MALTPVQASLEASQSQDDDTAMSPQPSKRLKRSLVNITVERTDVLDCGVCCYPLKPPLFQCPVGHVVCHVCRDKLARTGKCHVCRAPTAFERPCYHLDGVVAAHGCTYRPAYHDGQRHGRECPYAPLFRCPRGGEDDACCCFVTAVDGLSFGVELHEGFNFVLTAVRGNAQHLLLLNVATTVFGRAVSVHLLARNDTKCELELSYSCYKQNLPGQYYQKAQFHVACTGTADLSDGVPDPKASFQFFVPKCDDGSNEVTFKVSAQVFIPTQEDKPRTG